LYENQARFDIIYATVANGGGGATVGVQYQGGPQITQFSCNSASLSNGLGLVFTEPDCGTSTPTPTGTAPTATNTDTPTDTFTPTDTRTPTNTFTPTNTATNTPTP